MRARGGLYNFGERHKSTAPAPPPEDRGNTENANLRRSGKTGNPVVKLLRILFDSILFLETRGARGQDEERLTSMTFCVRRTENRTNDSKEIPPRGKRIDEILTRKSKLRRSFTNFVQKKTTLTPQMSKSGDRSCIVTPFLTGGTHRHRPPLTLTAPTQHASQKGTLRNTPRTTMTRHRKWDVSLLYFYFYFCSSREFVKRKHQRLRPRRFSPFRRHRPRPHISLILYRPFLSYVSTPYYILCVPLCQGRDPSSPSTISKSQPTSRATSSNARRATVAWRSEWFDITEYAH